MSDTEGRVRELEIWRAGVSVEVDHLKDRVKETIEAIAEHATHDAKARAALKSENRRFLVGVLMLVLATVLAAYFK